MIFTRAISAFRRVQVIMLLALAPGLSAAGAIIDNTDTGFTIVGNWPVSTGVPGFYGSNYQYTNKGDGARTAHWQFNIGSAGDYDVEARWTAHPNRATNAPYSLYNNGVLVGTVTANQQASGGQFNLLGTYTLAAGTLEIVLDNAADGFVIADAIQVTSLGVSNLPPDGTINTPAADVMIMTGETVNFTGSYSDPEGNPAAAWLWTFGTGSGVADATVEDPGPVQFNSPGSFTVRFTVTDSNGASDPTPGQVTVTVNAPPGSITIIDNTDPGFSSVGNWPVSTGVNGFYGSNYQYTNKGDGSRTAHWQFNIGTAGDYDVAARWAAHSNRATDALYSIYNNGILIGAVTVNQQTSGGQFNLLGTYTLAAGTLEVVLDNAANGFVIADAIQVTSRNVGISLPVDPYKVVTESVANGVYRISGGPGSANTNDLVTVENTASGTQVVAIVQSDGSFSVDISANAGDKLSIVVTDGSGNESPPGTVYAGRLTIKNPYTADGYWYLGQTHLHSTNSDGINSPKDMEAAYYNAGYDFVISTDHRGTSPYFTSNNSGLTPDPDNSGSGKDLLWIRGTELGYGSVHMGAWGHTIRTPLNLTIQEQIDTVRSNGGITVINHPENSKPPFAWDWNTEIKTVQRYSMIEAFNAKHPVEVESLEHKRDAVDLADEFRQVWWIGTDDCHNKDDPTQFNKYAIVVQTASPVMQQQDLLGSADAGNMYIRETAGGPELGGVTVAGNTVTVTLADIASAYNVVWKQRGDEVIQQDTGVDSASSYTVQGDEGYVRAEIERVSDGRMAYTQPLFIGNALDLSVSASASSGNGQVLVDNEGSTVWDAGASSGSFVVDVGTLRQVNALRIDWDDTDTRRFNYRIEVSDTGIFGGEEVEVVRETYANRSAATLDFFDMYTRYIRVVISSQSEGSGDAVRIREVEVYDASPDRTQHYIDNVNGDDSNSGLAGSPWRTFDVARERTRPRDTLHFVNTGVPFSGMMELWDRHSGKHPGAIVRYQGDPVNLTEIDATGDEYGFRFVGTEFVEWLNFAVHSANDGNVLVIGAKPSTGIYYNRIYDGLKRGVRANGDMTLGYNLIYGNATEGVFVYTDGWSVDIHNNVFYDNWRGLAVNSDDIDVTARNNIFSGHADIALYETSTGTITDSHNCVNGSYSGDWQKLSNVEADPLFVNPAAGNFALQSGSPCIDAGIDLGMTADFLGNDAFDVPAVPNTGSPGAFSRDYIDIGAIEIVQ